MGGLARRVSYIKAFKQRSNTEVPTLLVDAGNLFSDDRFSAPQLPAEVMTKNKWVVKGYGDFHHDAANISYLDLPYLGELLKKDGFDKRAEEFPFIERLVSSNIHPMDDLHRDPAAYVIRELTLKRGAPGRTLRVGIVGFSEEKPAGPNMKETVYAGFRIDDPFETAKKILPELKQKSDLIVALAYMDMGSVQRLATENPEIDTIIAARQTSSMDEAQHFNRATITYAYNQTKYLGELRVYVKGDGSAENQVNRYVALDSNIPDDASALEVVTAAHTEFTNEQNTSAQAAAPAKPNPLLASGDSPYVGVETCAGCHEKEHQVWVNSRHGHAMATLEKKNQQFDNECVRCHVVGFQKGGFQSLYTTPQFANVQCEECHGPGRQHASNPGKGYGFMATPVGCMQCHKEPNDPDFDFAVYWPKIKH
ncbi:MAG TPA: multiheme c-type cytochrome [Blastocatellia bacterium]|nr:multiheme c-type cytochrome [Blastocatellia bacterium]